MAQGKATVKAVLSGDTVVLMGSSTNGPPPEMQLTLSSLQAPRLARHQEQRDEPFAWESREFLRKLCIGKPVSFKVEYRVDSINRSFGSIFLDGENLCLAVAREGWAAVKTVEQSKDGACQDHEEMLKLEARAVAEKKGIHADATPESVREVKWSNFDSQQLLNEYKGKLVPAVVENVLNGGALRCLLHDTFHVITVCLSGVQCPKLNTAPRNTAATSNSNDAQKAPSTGGAAAVAAAAASAPPQGGASNTQPEPFAREAKFFTETRLLHRDIQLRLEGVDKFGNFFGTAVHPAGNISVELLKHGLARMVDWSAAFCTMEDRLVLRQAEKAAKEGQVRVWKGWQPTVIQGDKEYKGTVVEVVSGDTIVVMVDDESEASSLKEERRVHLASLRAPRMGNARRGEKDQPWAYESKEFLRSKCIGKTVQVTVDYERDPPAEAQGLANAKRSYVTAILEKSKKNLSEIVVAEGLAEVARHRQGKVYKRCENKISPPNRQTPLCVDDDRAVQYDQLLAAEAAAQKAKKGMYSSKEPGQHRVTDLSVDSSKAKQYLPFLRREHRQKAIVQFVYSAGRVKLYIPKENCLINFAIAGIRTPQPARAASNAGGRQRPAQAADPFGEEAKAFGRQVLLQRQVEVEVEDMDRGGNVFGPLFISQGKEKGNNYGVRLIEEGLAQIDDYSIDRTRLAADLTRAQDEAMAAGKKGLWKNYDALAKEKKNSKTGQASSSDMSSGSQIFGPVAPDQIMNIVVSEVVNGGHFWAQKVNDSNLSTIERKMKEFTQEVGISGGAAVEARRGSLVAALFDDGNGKSWFRAKVESTNVGGTGQCRVRFIDYGNVAELGPRELRPLDSALASMAPCAKECHLAFLKVPTLVEEFGRDAAIALNDLVWGKTVVSKVHGKGSDGIMEVTLYEEDSPVSVSETLVQEGLARVPRSVQKKAKKYLSSTPAPTPEGHPVQTGASFVQTLVEAEEIARKSRANLWQYGDIGSDDEEMESKGAWGRR